jgi:hypothetical protein
MTVQLKTTGSRNKSWQCFSPNYMHATCFCWEEVIIRHRLFVPDDFLSFVGLLIPDTVGCPYPTAVSHTPLKPVNFYPHFPHLPSSLAEIRHKTSAHNADKHSWVSWTLAQGTPCIFACTNKTAFTRVPWNLTPFLKSVYCVRECSICCLIWVSLTLQQPFQPVAKHTQTQHRCVTSIMNDCILAVISCWRNRFEIKVKRNCLVSRHKNVCLLWEFT